MKIIHPKFGEIRPTYIFSRFLKFKKKKKLNIENILLMRYCFVITYGLKNWPYLEWISWSSGSYSISASIIISSLLALLSSVIIASPESTQINIQSVKRSSKNGG